MDIEITKEMLEAVAQAILYKDDPIIALRKVLGKKASVNDINEVLVAIKTHPDFKKVQEDVQKLEVLGLGEDNLDTLMLQYNKMLQNAKFEKNYDLVIRILKEIRQIKSIENEQMKFEIVIKVEEEKES